MDTPEKRRWYCLTPGWLVFGSLAVTGLLFASEKWGWFPFNGHKGYTVLAAVAGMGVVLVVMLLWWLVALIFRWRFQFGIRTLLALTVVVAVPLSWLAAEVKAAKRQKAAVAAIAHVGGWTCAQWQVGSNLYPLSRTEPPEPKWLRNLIGNDFFDTVVYVDLYDGRFAFKEVSLEWLRDLSQVRHLHVSDRYITDVGLKCLKGLSQLEILSLSDTEITDAGMENLEGLCQLRYLDISANKISDGGLQHLKGLTRLELLYLSETQVTDFGLDYLLGMGQLTDLDLSLTQVTDRGLLKLTALGSLQRLQLVGNEPRVTKAGIQKLQQVLPLCDISG